MLNVIENSLFMLLDKCLFIGKVHYVLINGNYFGGLSVVIVIDLCFML